MEHELKLWPQFFNRTASGEKPFEFRINDRGFQKGDTVLLKEWQPEETTAQPGKKILQGYTGREMRFEIGYVMQIDAERCVFSLIPLKEKS